MMKQTNRYARIIPGLAVVLASAVLVTMLAMGVFAQEESDVRAINTAAASYEIIDTSPAIYVTERNADSVVGVIVEAEVWNRRTRETTSEKQSEGSGVVIAEGGYILTNYHVVYGGDSYLVMLPSGEKVAASLVGYDASYDLAVVKVEGDAAAQLVPAAIGSVANLRVGSTAVAIGNPGGETLHNTVTSGVISSLAREVDGGNTSRSVDYIQHDAAINNGNSGGGLFDVNGNLVGINTLKMSGGMFQGSTFEGLGFAIPIDTAYPIAVQLIETGTVARAGLGVGVVEAYGADEATDTETPAGLSVRSLLEDGPAQRAGIEVGDFIIAINGERVTTTKQLTAEIDKYAAGDTVTITVVRYVPVDGEADDGFTRTAAEDEVNPFYENPFGDWREPVQQYRAQTLEIAVVLEILN